MCVSEKEASLANIRGLLCVFTHQNRIEYCGFHTSRTRYNAKRFDVFACSLFFAARAADTEGATSKIGERYGHIKVSHEKTVAIIGIGDVMRCDVM